MKQKIITPADTQDFSIFKCGEGEGPTEVRSATHFEVMVKWCGNKEVIRVLKGNRKNPCGIINILYLDYVDWSSEPMHVIKLHMKSHRWVQDRCRHLNKICELYKYHSSDCDFIL